jgi:hypothetical protein
MNFINGGSRPHTAKAMFLSRFHASCKNYKANSGMTGTITAQHGIDSAAQFGWNKRQLGKQKSLTIGTVFALRENCDRTNRYT